MAALPESSYVVPSFSGVSCLSPVVRLSVESPRKEQHREARVDYDHEEHDIKLRPRLCPSLWRRVP